MSRVAWLAIIGGLVTGFLSLLLGVASLGSGDNPASGLYMLAAGITFALLAMAVLLSLSVLASRSRD